MHGRPRQKAGPPDPERTKAAAQKAARLIGQRSRLPAAAAACVLPARLLACSNLPTPALRPLPLACIVPPAQAALFGQLAGEVLARRAAGRTDPESLALAAKLLELHPEASQGGWELGI